MNDATLGFSLMIAAVGLLGMLLGYRAARDSERRIDFYVFLFLGILCYYVGVRYLRPAGVQWLQVHTSDHDAFYDFLLLTCLGGTVGVLVLGAFAYYLFEMFFALMRRAKKSRRR